MWQLFGFITRWLSGLTLWWTLNALWPSRRRETAYMALLFVVYPGFSQQFIAVTYSHVFLILTLFLVSLGAMIYALRKPRWFWPLYFGSILCSGYSMFAVEYFFGLELLRPVFLWMVLSEKFADWRKRLWRMFTYWLPYLILEIAFLFWRLTIQDTPRGEVDLFTKLQLNIGGTFTDLAEDILSDTYQSSFLAWAKTLDFGSLRDFGTLPTLLYGAIVLVSAVVAIFFLINFLKPEPTDSEDKNTERRWAIQAILVGMLALFLGGWPFWSTNLPIELRFPWDRFTIPMMLGTSLLLVGLLELVFRSFTIKTILLGLLIGLAVGGHFQNANLYRREWNNQKAFFWQLTWRAPDIQPGTMLLASELPFIHYSDNSLTAPLNWSYQTERLTTPMPYLLYAIESRIGKTLPNLKSDLDIEENYRASHFTGSTSQAVVFYFQPPGCVKILDPTIDTKLPQKPKFISDAMHLSQPGFILTDGNKQAHPPTEIFGPEPDPDWCYYFEQADLARQKRDWERIVSLGEQAFELNQRLYEVNAPELLPYIEAYARTGDWDGAIQLSQQAYQLSFRMDRILCSTWKRIFEETPADATRQAASQKFLDELNCPTP